MHIRLFVALLVSAVSLQAQAATEPRPDGRRLQLGTDSLEVFVVRQGEQQKTGIVVDQLDTVRVSGELRIRRIYSRTDVALGNGADTLIDRFPDLAPRSVRSHSEGGGTEILTWRAGRVSGSFEQPGRIRRSIDTVAAALQYSSASFDLILRASPLAGGYEVTVQGFSGRQGAKTLTARVIASEVLPGFGDTWRVERDIGGRAATAWIAKTSRRLVRQVIQVSPGLELLIAARS
jgi:hypothetical protein